MEVPATACDIGMSNSRTHVDRVPLPRRRPYDAPVRFGKGVDFGSDGFSVVEMRDGDGQIVKTLAWFAGHRTPACGIRGFGHVYVPAQLMIAWNEGFKSVTLQRGGRLSASALGHHAEVIDAHFGAGTTAQIDIRRTLLIADG